MNKFVTNAWMAVIAMLFCGSDIFYFIILGIVIGLVGLCIKQYRFKKYSK